MELILPRNGGQVREPRALNCNLRDMRAAQAHFFNSATTTRHSELGSGLHIAIDPDKGTIATVEHDTARLVVSDVAPDLGWAEFAIKLEQPEWRSCPRIYLQLRASAETQAHVRPALRLLREDGFHDLFAPEASRLGPEPVDIAAVYELSPKIALPATGLAVHLFLDTSDNRYDIHDLVLTGIH